MLTVQDRIEVASLDLPLMLQQGLSTFYQRCQVSDVSA